MVEGRRIFSAAFRLWVSVLIVGLVVMLKVGCYPRTQKTAQDDAVCMGCVRSKVLMQAAQRRARYLQHEGAAVAVEYLKRPDIEAAGTDRWRMPSVDARHKDLGSALSRLPGIADVVSAVSLHRHQQRCDGEGSVVLVAIAEAKVSDPAPS